MKVVAMHQPQYLPYLGFFHKLRHSDLFVVLDDVQFSTGGFLNRNKIKNRQGWQWLTVPVFQGSRPINEVEVKQSTPWQRKHCNSLVQSYSKSRYFEEYGPGLQELLLKPWHLLVDLDMALIEWGMQALGLTTPILCSSRLQVEGAATNRLVEICKAVGADCYLSGPGGANYMDLEAFAAAGVQVRWQEFASPVYEQVFPQAGFIPNLAVVDALFCCGPDTARFLD